MSKDYSLELKLDNATLRQQIEEIKRAFGGGSGSGSHANKTAQSFGQQLDKVFGGLAKRGFTSIISMGLKLSGMAIVMDKISKAVVSASPMLSQMLKLLDYGIMFMLRPIGDFIGFLLKPIVLYFFRYVAIPFYKYMAPFMQKYGDAIGTALTDPRIGIPAVAGILLGLGVTLNYMKSKLMTLASDIVTGMAPKASTSTTTTKPKDPFDPNTDISKTPTKGGTVRGTIDPKTGRLTITKPSSSTPKNPFDPNVDIGGGSTNVSRSPVSIPKTTVTTTTKSTTSSLSDAQKMISDRIKSGDNAYTKYMAKYAPNILKGVVKNLPELGVIVAAITGDPSWIVPGYGGNAGGETVSGLMMNNSSSYTTASQAYNPLFTGVNKAQYANAQGEMPNDSYQLVIQVGTVIGTSLQDAADELWKYISPKIQQSNGRRTK